MPLCAPASKAQREGAPAHALVGDRGALVFDAVGPFHDEGERQAGDGDALGIAQERRQIDRFSRTVDPALGVEIGVERMRRRAAFHAAVGQIEGGRGKIEEIIIAVWRARDDEAGRHAAGAARKARIEAHAAVGAGRRRRQDLVVMCDEAEFDTLERRGGGQRTHQHEHAVLA